MKRTPQVLTGATGGSSRSSSTAAVTTERKCGVHRDHPATIRQNCLNANDPERKEIREMETEFLAYLYIFLRFYLFIFRERRREGERETLMCERYINRLPLTCPQPGTWPVTQACALTGNPTDELSVCGMTPNLLSHTSQG